MHIQGPIQVNITYSLSQGPVHYKTKNTKSSEVNMHTNIIENTIKQTLLSSYIINKHIYDFIT